MDSGSQRDVPDGRPEMGFAGGEQIAGIVAGVFLKRSLIDTIKHVLRCVARSWFERETFTLVITPRRIVFAEFTTKMLHDTHRENGLWKQLRSELNERELIQQRYGKMPVEEILSESGANFSVERGAVCSVSIREGWEGDVQGTTVQTPTEVRITCAGRRYVCCVPMDSLPPEGVEKAFESWFPGVKKA